MEFTQDQKNAIDKIISFVESRHSLLTVGGFAGTGKTTVLAIAMETLRSIEKFKGLSIAYCCYTGKASMVLREKLLNAKAKKERDYIGTIHGLIYMPFKDRDGAIKFEKVSKIDQDIIVIDEASMISDLIFEDLKSYNKPIIAVGDHGQLPPLFSKYNLMEKPMVRLEKIHRQAEGDPIIYYSMLARNGEKIKFGDYGSVVKTNLQPKFLVNSLGINSRNYLILSWKNQTRIELNLNIRTMFYKTNDLEIGESVICLKNNRKEGIFNGMVGIVKGTKKDGDFYYVRIKFDIGDFEWSGWIFKHQFNYPTTLRMWKDYKKQISYEEFELKNLFDFGYVLTVHKAQGSQSDKVILIDEMVGKSTENYNRWLYTGITRAKKELIILSDK